VIILGDLQVDGTTTTINSTTLEVDDKNIELSKGAANKAASDGAGISIDLGTDGAANLTYGATDDRFIIDKGLEIGANTIVGNTSNATLRLNTSVGSMLTYNTNSVQVLNSEIRVNTSNIQRISVTSNGNVGIGTSSPNRRLSVSASGETIPLQINNASTTAGQFALIRSVISTDQDNIASSVDFGGIRTASNNADFIVRTNATERLRILNNGNVGIGTTSPAEILHISGAAGPRIEHTADRALGFVRTGANTFTFEHDTARFYLYNTTTAVSPILFNNNGTVGINETSPTAQLVVKSGATNRIPLIVDSLTGQTADLQRWLINGSNISKLDSLGAWYGYGVYNLANGNNGFLRLADTGATISRNIADTNPALIVNLANASATGNIQVWQKAGVAKAVIDNGGYFSGTGVYNLSSSANAVIFLNNTGTEINRNVNDANVVLKVKQQNVSATGDLQQWIYGTNTYAYVDKDGDFYNASGSYGQISDLRVKENIVEARDYTEDLMKLRVVKYSLKKDQEQEATKLGFIAQEVEEVFPNMVQTTETDEIKDLKSIKMSVLIPMLVKTIQEQEKRIKELEAKIK
jgi:hypothetical protein